MNNYATGEEPKEGDRVQFIGGGPILVVMKIPTKEEIERLRPPFYFSNQAQCSWFDKKHSFKTEWMKIDCLRFID